MSRHRFLFYLLYIQLWRATRVNCIGLPFTLNFVPFGGDEDGWETIEMQEHIKESFLGRKT